MSLPVHELFGSRALKTFKKKQDSTKAHREAGAMTTLGSSKVEQMLHRDQWSIGREHHFVDLLE